MKAICVMAMIAGGLSAGVAWGQKPPLLPEKDVAALANELSGETAKRNLEVIATFHRQRGSKGFHTAAELVAERARAYGLSDVQILEFPADALELFFVQDGSPLQEALAAAQQSWLLPFLPDRMGKLPSYAIRLREFRHWDDFAASLPASTRHNLRRRSKRLNEKGHVELGWCKTVDDVETALTWMFANKRKWAAARGLKIRSVQKDEQSKAFFGALAQRTDLSLTPLVAFMKVDGVLVAASLNLVGQFNQGNQPVIRWQHELMLDWTLANWGAGVNNHFLEHYKDVYSNAGSTADPITVSNYSIWNGYVSFKPIPALKLLAGINNLFDTNPPFSNQNQNWPSGYNPIFSSAIGRTFYGRITFDF